MSIPVPIHNIELLLDSSRVTRVHLDEWAQPRRTLMQRVIGVLLAEPQQAIAEARAVLARQEDGGKAPGIVDLVETILAYKLPMLNREVLQKMLELTHADLKQSRFYQDIFAEGEQEGRQKEGVALILRLLQRRCGELAPAIQERIARLSLPQLEALGEALLEFRGTVDLEQWLATHGQKSKA